MISFKATSVTHEGGSKELTCSEGCLGLKEGLVVISIIGEV